eukprot:scaffold781_cov132-Cylindrotheca_fusiformis.AAC.14
MDALISSHGFGARAYVPSVIVVEDQTDLPRWFDRFGDGCDWYEESDFPGCPIHGKVMGTDKFSGISAIEACCYCQEGNMPARNPAVNPPSTSVEIDPKSQDSSGLTDKDGDSFAWHRASILAISLALRILMFC